MRTIVVCALTLLSGCAGPNILPSEAPENGGVLRVSRLQGNMSTSAVPVVPANVHGDMCQITELGKITGCIILDHDGCGKIRYNCPEDKP